ncbi:glycosyltransferase family 4 protein [Salinicoccus sp. ID82-1]|uniref:Glycosyltransferase family 4 protein n=1 Tax=Salinicoccus cyprini TaxID=2493691 RepID=A0A558AX61_9STAP|nr:MULTISPECIES: glycosyltransferase family 4 protein [Salinicoccus]MCG1009982.1 glycosyltransferase family 4 protein [Salinicoccus sp. ID82-1]TVT28846.1 glycosyltransferase family 4 protein [Salinicoccus cyprini]
MTRYLMICNAYPTRDKVYANGFLHRRVKAYQTYGIEVDVIVMTTRVMKDRFHDGVHIKYMDQHQVASFLKENHYPTVLFHFINPKMFHGITQLPKAERPNIVVWLHGFEAEAWHRRYYNFLSDIESLDAMLERKDTVFETQRSFLREIMTSSDYSIRFVYVSRRFKELYVDPYTGVVPKEYYIIPNIVDDQLFPYRQKVKTDRLNLCSIRPYTARNYANDLTVDFIMALSRKRYFSKLTFDLYGDGPLFEVVTEPLKRYGNVNLHQSFVPQNEIPDIHESHGVFICPTRHDSQGVSIGEAMSSGLVPLSNDVGGVPEFVEHGKTGMLAPRDDVETMVENFDHLYKHPKTFMEMSAEASRSIHRQAGVEAVIKQEMEVIQNGWS